MDYDISFKLSVKKFKDSTGNWQTTLSGGLENIAGSIIVEDMITGPEFEKLPSGELKLSSTGTYIKANQGYWSVDGKLTNVPKYKVTGSNVELTEISDFFDDDQHPWALTESDSVYFGYLANSLAKIFETKYKELFNVEIVLNVEELPRQKVDNAGPTGNAPGSTGNTPGPTGNTPGPTGNTPGPTGNTATNNSTLSTTGPTGPTMYGEFVFDVQKENFFINSQFGNLEIITKGILKEEKPEELREDIESFDGISDEEFDSEYVEEELGIPEELKQDWKDFITYITNDITPRPPRSREETAELVSEFLKDPPARSRSVKPPAELVKAMKEWGITSALEQSHFLAQCAVETGSWQWTYELGGPTYCAKYEPTTRTGKNLGNTQTGDGYRFKGRGYIHLTGRANYTSFNNYLKEKGFTDDVVAHPELVATKYAAYAAVYFWKVLGPAGVKNFPVKANQGSGMNIVEKISRWVNGGNNGMAQRKEKFKIYYAALKDNVNAYG